jgi:hypothetical protein
MKHVQQMVHVIQSCYRILSVVASIILLMRCESRVGGVYEIPSGYRGWIEVRYERPSCPPLVYRDGKYIFRIPATGVLCTSSKPEFGWAHDEFFYLSKGERTPLPDFTARENSMIWGAEYFGKREELPGPDVPGFSPQNTGHFYVGTKSEFEAHRGARVGPE